MRHLNKIQPELDINEIQVDMGQFNKIRADMRQVFKKQPYLGQMNWIEPERG